MTQPQGIVTPEAVLLEFDEAGLASRILSLGIDVLIQGAALLGLGFLVAIIGSSGEAVAIIFIVIGVFLVMFGYPILMETLTRGRTVGKMALGLRVVTVEGAPIRFRHAAIRGFFAIVEFLLLPALAVLAALLSRRHQRVGDMVAGTIVLRERSALLAPTAYTFTAPPGYESYVASIDVGGLGDDAYAVIRSFLLRVRDLDAGARNATALQLADRTTARLGHTPPAGIYPELFLACVAAAYQARTAPVAPWVPSWSPYGEPTAAAPPPPSPSSYPPPPPPPPPPDRWR